MSVTATRTVAATPISHTSERSISPTVPLKSLASTSQVSTVAPADRSG